MALYDQTPGVSYDDPTVFYDETTPAAAVVTTMKKAKITFGSGTPDVVADITDAIVAAMTGNANFATPDPALPGLTTQAQALRSKKVEIAGLEADLKTRRGQLADMTDDLKMDLFKLRDYVQDESDGDPNIIHSAGMQIVGERTPVGPMTQVLNLNVSVSDAEGTLETEWQPVYGALVYLVETATDPDGPWTQITASSRSHFTITNLTPGTKYWVRVRAVGAAGVGPYSDPACKIAA